MSEFSEIAKRFRWQDAVLPCFAAASVLALLFVLPTSLMDLLLSVNIAISATIFLSTFFIRKPLDFSVFPTVLLATTLYRLVLNVSTTRLILTQADAGEVVDAFSRFVAGDNIVVGLVIFAIFVIIQFVVITKGATRIGEVSARFALDALPGRQMAIDADLNAGNISAEEARKARAELAEEADFFGAMDGASKFVRGDAIAGLAIVFINLVGGLFIGIVQEGRPAAEAFGLYSRLTIGDGLVSQVPAFLISLATGLLVARTSTSQNVSEKALKQTFGKPVVVALTGVFLLFLAATGLPVLPILTLAGGCFALAWALSKNKEKEEKEEERRKSAEEERKRADSGDDVDRFLTVDPMELEIGVGLIPLADPESGENLLDRVRRVRQKIAAELGLVLPKVRIRDNSALDENQYLVKIKGETVALGIAYPNMSFAVDGGFAFGRIQGLQTKNPVDGSAAFWIDPATREEATAAGYDALPPGAAIELALTAIARREAAELLTRDATKRLVDRLRETAPTVVDELIPETLKLAQVQQILQLLLKERVSIRRLDVILETLSDFAPKERNLFRLLDFVRERLARTLSAQYRDEDGFLRVAMLEPEAEETLRGAVERSEFGVSILAPPTELEALGGAILDGAAALQESGAPAVLLVDRSIRTALRNSFPTTDEKFANLAILSFDEIDATTRVSQEVVVDWRKTA